VTLYGTTNEMAHVSPHASSRTSNSIYIHWYKGCKMY